MTRRRAIIIAAIILGLLALAIGGFFLSFEKVEEEVFKPPAGEARTNRYLALERLLNADGWSADTVMTITEPQWSDGLMIVTGSTADYGPEQIEWWDRWVARGGHLVITEVTPDLRRQGDMTQHFGFGAPPEPAPEEDAIDAILPDESEVEDSGGEEESREEDENESEEENESEGSDGSDAKVDEADEEFIEKVQEGADSVDDDSPRWGPSAEVPEGVEVTSFNVDCPWSTLEDRLDELPEIDRVWLGNNDCLVAASTARGEGRVTMVPELDMFSNTKIRKYQHPKLAHDLFWQATGTTKDGATISLYGKRISWIGYLWGLFWPTGISLLIILAFALLAGTKRFGPVVAPPSNERRRRTEHVIAIGRFLWKHESADALLKATQNALLRRVSRGTIPTNLDRDDRAKWLAERTELSLDEARRMLAEHAPTNAEQFAHLIKSIEDLRRR